MFDICKQKTIAIFAMVFLEAPTRFELVIEVLQTFALPLGYDAVSFVLCYYIKDFFVCQEFWTHF